MSRFDLSGWNADLEHTHERILERNLVRVRRYTYRIERLILRLGRRWVHENAVAATRVNAAASDERCSSHDRCSFVARYLNLFEALGSTAQGSSQTFESLLEDLARALSLES